MPSLSIISCITGEPETLYKTAESIKSYLSEDINWIIKFSDKVDLNFIEGFRSPYTHVYQRADSSLYEAINQSLSFV